MNVQELIDELEEFDDTAKVLTYFPAYGLHEPVEIDADALPEHGDVVVLS